MGSTADPNHHQRVQGFCSREIVGQPRGEKLGPSLARQVVTDREAEKQTTLQVRDSKIRRVATFTKALQVKQMLQLYLLACYLVSEYFF